MKFTFEGVQVTIDLAGRSMEMVFDGGQVTVPITDPAAKAFILAVAGSVIKPRHLGAVKRAFDGTPSGEPSVVKVLPLSSSNNKKKKNASMATSNRWAKRKQKGLCLWCNRRPMAGKSICKAHFTSAQEHAKNLHRTGKLNRAGRIAKKKKTITNGMVNGSAHTTTN